MLFLLQMEYPMIINRWSFGFNGWYWMEHLQAQLSGWSVPGERFSRCTETSGCEHGPVFDGRHLLGTIPVPSTDLLWCKAKNFIHRALQVKLLHIHRSISWVAQVGAYEFSDSNIVSSQNLRQCCDFLAFGSCFHMHQLFWKEMQTAEWVRSFSRETALVGEVNGH